MTDLSLTGGCMCGRHRYEITAKPMCVSHCHCADCRRASGGTSITWMTIPSTGFRWVGERPAAFASSPGVERLFCQTCGTSLAYQSAEDTSELDVSATTLDDPDRVQPDDEIWWSTRLSWAPEGSGLPKLDRDHWTHGYPHEVGYPRPATDD